MVENTTNEVGVLLASEVVKDLNDEFYEKVGNEEWQPFQLKWNGDNSVIYFLGKPIFDSNRHEIEGDMTLRVFVLNIAHKMLREIEQLRVVVK